MPVSLLDIAISVVGVGQAVQGLQGLSASALQAYSSNEMLVQSLDSLVAKQIATANNTTLDEARKQSLGLTQELARWSQRLGIISPFSQEAIASTFQMGTSLQMTIDQAKRATTAFTDFTSATAQGPYEMEGLQLALGQVMTKGKLSLEEAGQLLERRVPVWEYLQRAIGKTTGELQDMATAGLIPANVAFDAIVGGLERDFAGAAEQASTTVQGITASFQDLISVSQRTLVGPTIETLKPMAIDAVDYLQSDAATALLAQWSLQMAEFTDTAIPAVQGLAGTISDELVPVLQGSATMIGVMGAVHLWGGLSNAANAAIGSIRYSWMIGQMTATTMAMNRMYGAAQPIGSTALAIAPQVNRVAAGFRGLAAGAMMSARNVAAAIGPLNLTAVALGGVAWAWQRYEQQVRSAAQATLENHQWWLDSQDAIQNANQNIVNARLHERQVRAEIAKLEKEQTELKDRLAGASEKEASSIRETIAANNADIAQKQKQAQQYLELAKTQKHYGDVLSSLKSREQTTLEDLGKKKNTFETFGVTDPTKTRGESLAEIDELENKAQSYRNAIINVTTAANEADAQVLAFVQSMNESPTLNDPASDPAAAFLSAQGKVTDLAAQQAQKLLGIRQATDQKMADQWDSYHANAEEAHYQHNRALTESDYQHQRAVEEAKYQFHRQQAEAERQWQYEQSEATRKHAMDMAEAQRDRYLELAHIADDLRPTSQAAVDALAETEADFHVAALERLEDFNAKRQLLARQGAMCKLPEERKAFAEQEAQAAEAYQKQQEQQREALGRQLIDYTVAMALKNDVGAQAMQAMVTGIAQATGVYDSVTAGLMGQVFGGIAGWAQSGGQGAESVLNTIRQLPDAAREAKQAEHELSATLREQAVQQFQRTGDVNAYQRALNAIPSQVATRLGVSTNEALPMSDVYQGQEDWLRQQAEAERDYAMQVEEDNRAHQHTMAEDWHTHNLDLEEMYRQHRRTLDEEQRQYRLDQSEAWRLHLKELEDMRGKDHQKQLEEAMKQGDLLMAEALAQAGNLSAIDRATLTGDYRAALDYELKMQNWLNEKLDRVDYSDPTAAREARENIFRSYGGLRQQYGIDDFRPADPRMPHGGTYGTAPAKYDGVPLNLTVNLEAEGLVLHTMNRMVRLFSDQWQTVEQNGSHK